MSITLTNKPDTAEPFIEYAKSRKGIVTRQFEPGMEEEISRLVKLCIDSSVPNYYEDPEPIKRALAHLYSPENILKKSEGDYPIYVSGPNGKISWVMQLSGVNLTNNTQVDSLRWEPLSPSKEPEVFAQELGMFYGEKSGTGIMSAMDLMVNAKTIELVDKALIESAQTTSQISKKTGLHPTAVKKSLSFLEHFGRANVMRAERVWLVTKKEVST